MKILFFGTPEFAKLILQKLINNKKFNILSSVSAPDSIVGRKKILTPSPVKKLSLEHKIPVLTPTNIKDPDFIKEITELNADIWLVIGYGKILSQSFINLMPNKIVNIHPSLLPKYRGPAPIQSSLINGDSETGVTLMKIDKYMDHGDIIAQESLDLPKSDTYIELEAKLVDLSYKLLDEYLEDYILDKIKAKPQNHELASIIHFVQKPDGLINWNNSAEIIYNQYRAFILWPQTFTYLNNKKIIIEFESVIEKKLEAGKWEYKEDKLLVGTNNQALVIKRLKPESKNWLSPKEFTNGYGILGKFKSS